MSMQCSTPTGFSGQVFTWLVVALGLASGLKVAAPPSGGGEAPKKEGPPPLIYDSHGMDWVDGMCFSRERQSPINLDDRLKDPPSDILKYHYEPLRNVKLQMRASKGLVFVDTSNLGIGEVVLNGDAYPLVRIDFHANSEHLLKGKRSSMEIQLVHRKLTDPMKSLIIAIPVWSEEVPLPPTLPYSKAPPSEYFPPKAEPDYNSALQQFLTVRPPFKEDQVVDVTIPIQKPLDLGFFVENPKLPESGTYVQYSGSLTTPPCSDMTTWFVRRRPMIAASGQTKAFADSIFRLTNRHGNFRAVMPVNQRVLNVYRAQWVENVALGVKSLPLGPNARTDKEFQAEKLADLAKTVSQDAVDYMSDFGKRLRRSSKSLAENFDKTPPMTIANAVDTPTGEWEKAVHKMQGAMHGIVGSVQSAVDKNMRQETMQVHKEAAEEAERARVMTVAWMHPNASSRGM